MIALYPGAYKPPHRGHFNVVKSLLDNSYNGSIYDKNNYKETGANLLKGTSDSKPKIDKVIVFVGAGERNGISKEESISIWNIYSKYLGNVEILDGGKNPMFAAKDYAQANPEEEFVSVTGIRGDKDFVDLRRVTTYKNAPNVQGLALAAAPDSTTRATDFRNSILSGNLDKITDFFPEDLSREEILQILTDLKDKIVAEILSSNIEGFMENYFSPKETIVVEDKAIKSNTNIDNLYSYLSRLIPNTAIIEHKRDSITVGFPKLNEEVGKKLELKDYITSLTEYMLDRKMNILPLPEIKIKRDPIEASNFFGRTAYYSPSLKEIVLFAEGRHDKDIVRSFAHEMIHHIQNIEGRLGRIGTSNTNEDEYLMDIEKEAYLLGNITFRNWEDSLKGLEEGLWANINAKKKKGKKASHKNSKAYKAAKKAGDSLEKTKKESIVGENITKTELNAIEKYADKLFIKLGIDIEFTKHFLDRANDDRNGKTITVPELIGMFKRLHRKHGKPLSRLDTDINAVVKDFNNDINVPFAIDVTDDGIDMYAKTIMRKKDFKTSTPVYTI